MLAGSITFLVFFDSLKCNSVLRTTRLCERCITAKIVLYHWYQNSPSMGPTQESKDSLITGDLQFSLNVPNGKFNLQGFVTPKDKVPIDRRQDVKGGNPPYFI